MATDWMATLENAADMIQQTEADALKLVGSENLSVEYALRLLDAINKLGDGFTELAAEMRADDGADEEWLEAATAIEARWTELTLACINKVRDLRGLTPFSLETDDIETIT